MDLSYDNIVFLIGNKIDLEEERKVTIEDTDTFKINMMILKYFWRFHPKMVKI